MWIRHRRYINCTILYPEFISLRLIEFMKHLNAEKKHAKLRDSKKRNFYLFDVLLYDFAAYAVLFTFCQIATKIGLSIRSKL